MLLGMGLPVIETPRLVMRDWTPADRDPFVAINADAAVMRYFPCVLTAAETDAMLARNRLHVAQRGFGF
ncbi:MAG: GNAT family N-acetyltransferase [Bryobacterales bacterium]|nr:GNAT family N-acetyltransferase [Bryobacterales bacterium]